MKAQPDGLARVFYWVTRLVLLTGIFSYFSDLVYFQSLAERVWNGAVPYRDLSFGYPPLAWFFLLLPHVLAKAGGPFFGLSGHEAYSFFFRFTILTFDLLLFTGLRIWAKREGFKYVPLVYVALTALLGPVLLDRMDIVVGALLAWLAVRTRGKRLGVDGTVIWGAGALLKLGPAAWGGVAAARALARKPRAKAWITGGVLALGALALTLVALPLEDTINWLVPLRRQLFRGVQIETLWGSLALVFTLISPFSPAAVIIEYRNGGHELARGMAPGLKALSVAATLFAVWLWCLRLMREPAPLQSGKNWFSASAGLFLLIMCFGWIGSPQLILWIVPLAVLASTELGGRDRWFFLGSLALASLLASAGIQRYFEVSSMYLAATLIVAGKNLALGFALVFLVRGMKRRGLL